MPSYLPNKPHDCEVLDDEDVTERAFWRLIPFLFILYVFSYLDRINISFAALDMSREFGLNATMFGVANTVFYVGYLLCEVPSNVLLMRYGARRWIARIMITWGIASTATIFAVGPNSLYAVRLLVGIAEAGFVPGILLYLTFWFPRTWRARATAVFMVAQPVTLAFGSLFSGAALGMDGVLGLAGWQWLFLVEGLPSVLLGFLTWFLLTDRPDIARWLTVRQRESLARRIASEQTASVPSAGLWSELRGRNVVLLCLSYFGLVTSLNTVATWTPQIVRELVANGSYLTLGLLAAIPGTFAIVTMPLWSARSDRSADRTFYYLVPLGLAALGWVLVILSASPTIRLGGMVLTTVGAFNAMAIFWTMPASALSDGGRPIGIAVITSSGILASVISPSVVGALRDFTGSFAAGLWYATALLAMAALMILMVDQSVRVQAARKTE